LFSHDRHKPQSKAPCRSGFEGASGDASANRRKFPVGDNLDRIPDVEDLHVSEAAEQSKQERKLRRIHISLGADRRNEMRRRIVDRLMTRHMLPGRVVGVHIAVEIGPISGIRRENRHLIDKEKKRDDDDAVSNKARFTKRFHHS
jgi:hypothetical protein